MLTTSPNYVDFGVLSTKQKWIGLQDFYTRGHWFGGSEQSDIEYRGNNLTTFTYNPSTSTQIFCFSCIEWVHLEQATTVAFYGNKDGSLKERAKILPVLRGGGWATRFPDVWRQVDKRFEFEDGRAWLIVGTYQVRKGFWDTQELKAAALFGDKLSRQVGFQCPTCGNSF